MAEARPGGNDPTTVYFVSGRAESKWRDLEGLVRDGVTVDEIQERMTTGVDAWVYQSYLILRDSLQARGVEVRFSREFVPNALCVAHRDDLRVRARPYRSYVVAVRADRPPVFACQLVVVQNRTMRQYREDEVEALETTAMVIAEMIATGDLARLNRTGVELDLSRPVSFTGSSFNDGIGLGHVVLHEPRIVVTNLFNEDSEEEVRRLDTSLGSLRI